MIFLTTMQTINPFPEVLRFGKLSISSRITLYFAVFGLLIFYLTSIAYIVVSQKHLAASVTRIVQTQISEMSETSPADAWWNSLNKKHRELRALAQTITSLTSGTHTVLDTSIYGRIAKNEPWQRLHLDNNGIMRVAPVDQSTIRDLSSNFKEHLVGSDSNLYLGSHRLALFINITSPTDRGEYFYKVAIDKQGVSCLMEDRALNFVLISLGALIVLRIVAYFFARPLARPVEQLSSAAAQVAEGDLSFQVPPMGYSEIGDLGRSFNKMIVGLRDLQRIKQVEIDVEKGREFQRNFFPGNSKTS